MIGQIGALLLAIVLLLLKTLFGILEYIIHADTVKQSFCQHVLMCLQTKSLRCHEVLTRRRPDQNGEKKNIQPVINVFHFPTI